RVSAYQVTADSSRCHDTGSCRPVPRCESLPSIADGPSSSGPCTWLLSHPCTPRCGRPGCRRWCRRPSGGFLTCCEPPLIFGSADAQAAIRQGDAFWRPVLHPPFVERPAADSQVGAHLRDSELVPLAEIANLVSAGHDDASRSSCRADRSADVAAPTGTAACPW